VDRFRAQHTPPWPRRLLRRWRLLHAPAPAVISPTSSLGDVRAAMNANKRSISVPVRSTIRRRHAELATSMISPTAQSRDKT
jgi:hypothetical protein